MSIYYTDHCIRQALGWGGGHGFYMLLDTLGTIQFLTTILNFHNTCTLDLEHDKVENLYNLNL